MMRYREASSGGSLFEADRRKMAAAASTATSEKSPTDQTIAELYQQVARGTELARSTISCNSNNDQVVAATPVQEQQQPERPTSGQSKHEDARLAPLASLDCSITEHTISESPIGGSSSSTITGGAGGGTLDTPTLRSCFECDELSDMVNDSLFEITSAGCLSKSVLNIDLKPAVVAAAAAAAPAASQQATVISSRQQDELKSALKQPQPPAAEQRRPANGIKPRSRSARMNSSASSSVPLQQTVSSSPHHRKESNGLPSRQAGPSILKESKKSSRRQTRSNPDVRQDVDDDQDEIDVLSEGVCGVCSKPIEQTGTTKKRGHRFTFSLFNLFSGSKSSVSDDDKCQCDRSLERTTSTVRPHSAATNKKQHHDLTSNHGDTHTSRSSPSHKDTGNSGIQVKSRDSIRLTNQRKQRNRQQQQQSLNSKPIRNSSSFNDFRKPNQPTTELLLDFPVARIQSTSIGATDQAIRSTLQSAIRHRDRLPSASGRLQQNHQAEPMADGSQAPNGNRPLKSVKFAQPDRILNSHEKASRSCLYILKSNQ